ncbi:helix-turn-helix transcriptional regulator [Streptomyces sp. NPDC096040]|uniref:helix-turn-helix domain-containing protein n=1 Tax=Streptomyces sp. NPDC096040 TaxID=3155541 RepID=UPI00332C0EB9
MTKSPSPAPPPEAALIKAALKRKRIRVEDAARQAGISRSRWGQIIAGYQSVSGQRIEVNAPDDTLARMCLAVGVTSAQLAETGRTEAADLLAELETPTGATAAPTAARYANDPHIDAIAALLTTLPPEAQDEVLRRVGRTEPSRTQQEPGDQHRRAS